MIGEIREPEADFIVKPLTHIAFVVLFMLGNDCLGQTEPKNPQKPAGAIAGRITADAKSVPGVRITALLERERFSDRAVRHKATTDKEGRFRISNLAAGIYRVLPNIPTYVVSELNGFVLQEKSVVLNEGEIVEDINFALIRGGVITGKVTDAEGHAVIGELIRLTPTDEKLRNAVDSGPGFQTDDRGVYRAYGLPPGDYKVAVGEDLGGAVMSRGRRLYKRTFYPDATDETKAKLVEVAQAAEVSNIDIVVGRSIETFSVSGRIVDAQTGQPLPGRRFRANTFIDGQLMNSDDAGVSDSNGRFTLDNVPVGSYSLSLIREEESANIGESDIFEVIDQDVTGVELKAHRGSTLTGVIVLEGTEDKAVMAMLSQLHLLLIMNSQNTLVSPADVAINPDGSFRVSGLAAGWARFVFNQQWKPNAKLSILRIERDGTEQPRGLKVELGEEIRGLRVVIGYGSGTLRGTVKVENGSPNPVYIYALLQRQSLSGSVTVKSTMVDTRGRFVMESIPPGNYDIALLVYDPASDQNSVKARQSVVISDGGVSEISISLNLMLDPKPSP